jgi:hypothetical protein
MILDEEVWAFVTAGCVDGPEAVGSLRVPGTRDKGSKSSRERLAIFESGERGVIYSDPRARLAMIICPNALPSAGCVCCTSDRIYMARIQSDEGWLGC